MAVTYSNTGGIGVSGLQQSPFSTTNTALNPYPGGVQMAAQPVYQSMARNALSDHCALLVYERRLLLKDAAERMPGDFDLNRKLLGDLFLMSPCHMTLEQAASLAFIFGEDCHTFLRLCDEVGAIIPVRE